MNGWNDRPLIDYEEFLSTVMYAIKISKPGAERVCLERIQTAIEEFIEYKKRKEEEKENASRTCRHGNSNTI